MSLEKLLKDRKIEKIERNEELAKKTFALALRDIAVAKKNLEDGNYDWTLAIAYNAMLQAGRALMFSKGYRPAGEYKHVGVLEFLREVFSGELANKMIDTFNRLRKKRHRVVYEETDITSESEAKNAIRFAEEFVNEVKTILNIT